MDHGLALGVGRRFFVSSLCLIVLCSFICQNDVVKHYNISPFNKADKIISFRRNEAIKLYGYEPSTCTRRVMTVLKEKGLDYEFVPVDVFAGAHKTEEYTNNFHPFNKIPVLVDEDAGVRIYESRAIAHYLATKYRDQGIDLSPSEDDFKAYAAFQQALSLELSYFEPNVHGIAWEEVFKPRRGLGPANPDIVKSKLEDLDASLKGYERILSKQKYLAGDSITLADLFHLSYGQMTEPLGFGDLLIKYPAVAKWWGGLKERDSWKKVNEGPEMPSK